MTENKMPDVIYLNDVDGDGVVDNFVWSSAEEIGQCQKYHSDRLYQVVCSERDALRGLCDGMEAALEGAKLRLEGAGMLGGMTDPVAYQLTAYQAHKEKMDGK